ncbi:hypothetical protein AOC36_07255 [Erysipelothrix larvae]|uniref:Polymerase nucleotidyl transferase domain-containing protein n=1 Tax=Erysipelothrix larvae TaxID=1514105 RepID=A0A0X8H0H3_9FIRM|nr:nucleotidyltransferase domain-containing protein [Erysipelothrix larvae]AMC93786.1 hypothetical protein AOC36_07255 [Erysipelothrix larvae]
MDDIMARIVESLKDIQGIEAIVLGGSRAQKTHDEDSDIDIGIYYNDTLNMDDLSRIVTYLDDEHRDDLLAKPGVWGKWVNGGAWMTIDQKPVDFILRDIHRVKYYLNQCSMGHVTAHYQTGHPHAYFNVMYVGELAICDVLFSRDNDFLSLKKQAEVYPEALKTSIINWFQFEARFSLDLAQKAIIKEDAYYINAHIVRSISSLNQIVFALNKTYCINEKNAVSLIETLPLKPTNYKRSIHLAIAISGEKPQQACELLENLICEIEETYLNH